MFIHVLVSSRWGWFKNTWAILDVFNLVSRFRAHLEAPGLINDKQGTSQRENRPASKIWSGSIEKLWLVYLVNFDINKLSKIHTKFAPLTNSSFQRSTFCHIRRFVRIREKVYINLWWLSLDIDKSELQNQFNTSRYMRQIKSWNKHCTWRIWRTFLSFLNTNNQNLLGIIVV